MTKILFVVLLMASTAQAQTNNCKKQQSCTGGSCQTIVTCG